MSSSTYILVGVSGTGVSEEHIFHGGSVDNATMYFALADIGPIKATEVAANLLDLDTITIEQYDLLEAVADISGVSFRHVVCYLEDVNAAREDSKYSELTANLKSQLTPTKVSSDFIDAYNKLVEAISDIASGYFNYGQFATDPYIWTDHNNFVDSESKQYQWKIYQIKPGSDATAIYPTAAVVRKV